MQLDDVGGVVAALADHGYLADEGLATSIFLALRLGRPLLLEGEAGVGKTEVAKVLARWTGGELIRLQCYEGIDASQAVYEWDYARQLLHLRAAEATGSIAAGTATDELTDELFSERFLVHRPLLRAVSAPVGAIAPVLLIDEVDRADDEFEAFLLEILADYAVTVPELGTFRAAVAPVVVITSNRTRDVHDALKRRCLYHWVEHPDFEREVAIVRVRAPEVPERLARQVAAATEVVPGGGPVQAAGRGRDDRLGPGPGRARAQRARRGGGGGHPRHACSSTARTRSGPATTVWATSSRRRPDGPTGDRSRAGPGGLRARAAPSRPGRAGRQHRRLRRGGRCARLGAAVVVVLGRTGDAGQPARGHRHLRPRLRLVLAGGAGGLARHRRPRRSPCCSTTRTMTATTSPTCSTTRSNATMSSPCGSARTRCCATRTSPPTPTPSSTRPDG